MKNRTKIFIFTLFFCILVVFVFYQRISANKYFEFSKLKLIYDDTFYLTNYSKETGEIENLKAEIISKIDPLVIIEYKYSSKDNLFSLAKKFGTNVDSLRSTNYIEALGLLYSGKVLLITNKRGMLYKVQTDSVDVFTIAKKFNKDAQEICLINEIPPTHIFQKGDYIFIPERYIRFRDFMLPLFNTRITSGFGLRRHPIFGILKYHEGVDLKQKYGASVRAAADGKVIYAGWAEGYGNLIILKHTKGYTTYYGHLSRIRVKIGQRVYKGQVIGNVGTTGWVTGPHLHFEVRKNGIPINPKKVLF
jgi:hypothetical protein